MSDNKTQQMERITNMTRLLEKQTGKAVRPYRADGYMNLMNRYGTSKDTTEHYQFVPELAVPDETLTTYYEGNGLFAKIIDAPAEEAVKHGFELEGISDEEVESFYQEALDELDWEETAMTAIKWARLFGGSIAVMLINDGGALEDPLNWKNIKSIDDIRVYDRSVINPEYSTMFSYDPRDPFGSRGSRLGMPEYYNINSRFGSFTVHESRCLVFQNGVLPENSSNSIYQMWGVPEYVRIHRALRDTEIAHGSAPKMLDRSVQPVYKMKDLSTLLATEQGEDMVLKRLQVIDLARGLLNSLVIDNEGEEYDFRTFQFTGVSDVIDATCNLLSALTNIPQTILFGRSPAGMNSTGESDLENWYNFVERIQKRMLRSNLRYLLSIIFQAGVATGEVDEVPKIKIKFKPLWSLSELEQADLNLKKAQVAQTNAQTAQLYVNMEVLDPTEVRRKLADSSEFDIDTILDEYEDEDELMAAYMGEEETPNQYGAEADIQEHATDPGTEGSAPANAPAATKLPQDMSVEESAKLAETKEKQKENPIINQDENLGSVGVLVVSDGKVLTGTRQTDFGYGLVCGPGGHIEKGETPEQAAFRETEEEFGISPKSLICLGRGPSEYETGFGPYLFLCTEYEGEPNCVDLEMAGAKFRTLEELDQLAASLFQPFADGLKILKTCIETCLFYDTEGNEMREYLVNELSEAMDVETEKEDGGDGSGNHGHKGVPGELGGSAPGDGTSYRGTKGSTCREYAKSLSGKTKAQIAKQAKKDSEFKKLTDTITLYTQGGYASQRKVAEKLVDGSFTAEDDFTVAEFINKNKFMTVKDIYKDQGLSESDSSTADGMAQLIGTINESEPFEGKLYRAAQDRSIVKVNGDYEPFVPPEVGQVIQISAPTSFTTDKAVADKILDQKIGDRIFYTIDEGANAVDVSQLSPYKQKEMLTCGNYEVVKVNTRVRDRSLIYGEATSAQKRRGLVDYYGSPVYELYDIEIQLKQVGKVSIDTKNDSKDNVLSFNSEQFSDRMVLEDTDESFTEDGGPGSGNWGHEGRLGKVGGSAEGGEVHNRFSTSKGYTSFAKQKKKFAAPHKADLEEIYYSPSGSKLINSSGVWTKLEESEDGFEPEYVNDKTGEVVAAFSLYSACESEDVSVVIPNTENPNYQKIKEKVKKASKTGTTESITDDRFSDERKANAYFAEKKGEADKKFRKQVGEVWQNLDDETKQALYDYTGAHYRNINKLLRGESVPIWGDKAKRQGELITEAISKCKLNEDIYLSRGVSAKAFSKMLGTDEYLFNINPEKIIGTTITDNGFMSCGTAKGTGFSHKEVDLKIYCPKGTQAMYAEPFSKHGKGAGLDWDGVSKQKSYSKEFETILQRDTSLQITNAYYDEYGYKLHVEAQIVGQYQEKA